MLLHACMFLFPASLLARLVHQSLQLGCVILLSLAFGGTALYFDRVGPLLSKIEDGMRIGLSLFTVGFKYLAQ
jgi:hypothetical protein